ncbi:MAG TPA: hypothetical protein ENI85_19285 [Deltaproteobacteria bacterium]|nr:hypothetical protein [Deltaproteobacteria bacterium]
MSRVSGFLAPACRMRWRGLFMGSAVAAWALPLLPSLARACSVCTAGRDEENAAAFLLTTIFMSILPLAALGTLVFVIWRRFRKLEAEAEAEARQEIARPATLAIPVSSEGRS